MDKMAKESYNDGIHIYQHVIYFKMYVGSFQYQAKDIAVALHKKQAYQVNLNASKPTNKFFLVTTS